jgi:hypothetical protein
MNALAARHREFHRHDETLRSAHAPQASAYLRSWRDWNLPYNDGAAPSPARSFTSMPVIRSWE